MRLPIMVLSIVFTCVSVLQGPGTAARAETFTMTGKTGAYTVEMRLEKGPPVEGTNRVMIVLMDGTSRPVTGARVKIDYYMPSLPGRPPMMGSSTTAKFVDGRYEAVMDLSMKGEWKADVLITDARETVKTTFTFQVR